MEELRRLVELLRELKGRRKRCYVIVTGAWFFRSLRVIYLEEEGG